MMKRLSSVVTLIGAAVVLLTGASGCSNSSGSLGKGRLSILNLVSVEGEGISWDNCSPAAAATTTQTPAGD